MRHLTASAIALSLFTVGAARAQTVAPSQPAKATSGGTVSGVTVEGRKAREKACSARDKDCIASVVAELRARFPVQLQNWCVHVQERAAMTDLMFDRSGDASPDGHPHENPLPYLPPPVTKLACASDPPSARTWK